MLEISRWRNGEKRGWLWGILLGLAAIRTTDVAAWPAAAEPPASPAHDPSKPVPKVDGSPITEREIGGRVVDADGKPIAGALVQAYSWTPFYKTHTDADGRFRLLVFNRSGMDPKEGAEMRFGKEGYGSEMFDVVKGGTANLAVTLKNTTYFEGNVSGLDGRPVADALVRASHPQLSNNREVGKYWYETRTDAKGHYRLHANANQFDFQIRVPGTGATRLTGQSIKDATVVPLNFKLARGIAFRAKVVDSQTNQPVSGVRFSNWQQPGIEGLSGPDGIATIEDMFPGRFDFQLGDMMINLIKLEGVNYARWWSEQCLSPWHRRMVEPDNSPRGKWQRNFDSLDFEIKPDMDMVTIVVEKAAAIRGRVLDPDGKAVAEATVAPALTGTGNSLTGDTRFSVESDKNGNYEIILPAGNDREYNLVAHDGKYQQWRTWANGVLPPVKTKPGEILEAVDITLTRPVTVRGRVVDEDGKAVADQEVRASAADQAENRYYVPVARTNADGEFEIKYLRPCEQYIQVAPFWLNAAEAPAGTSRTINAKPGEVVEDVGLIAEGKRVAF